ncbi:phenoloxidase-activating factor 1 [Drosophila miranda]|uniref:phenoloxidase-activating factor 1 n=1 Tax=Drosophila miranda TaxID=7229 RepID=UPI0007E715D8|nr:phenoloxidase-activating factor 1 [Drosophila miranda]
MVMAGKLVLLLVVAWLGALTRGDTPCGRLEERVLYITDERTEPSEYPWIGVLLQSQGNGYTNTRCTVVIVNQQHVLTTATCVKRFKNRTGNVSAVVMLGVWNESHSPDEEFACNNKGFCVPGPKLYNVAEIKVHPDADKDTDDNDMAILRLVEPIEWTNYIQPICMEGNAEPESLINRNLHFSGFTHTDNIKGKGLAMTVSRQKCKQLTSASTLPPENQLCGFPVKRTKFYEGAALMDISVERNVPHSFYVVALLARVMNVGVVTTHVYQDLRRARPWIMENTATK